MFYIPSDWLKDKDNKSEVNEILNKYLHTDLKDVNASDPMEFAIKELNKIGEDIIIEKLKEGTIRID